MSRGLAELLALFNAADAKGLTMRPLSNTFTSSTSEETTAHVKRNERLGQRYVASDGAQEHAIDSNEFHMLIAAGARAE